MDKRVSGWPICIFKNKSIVNLLKCCICNNIPTNAITCTNMMMGHVFCYTCIFDEAKDANEQKTQHTFKQKCPSQCDANTLVVAPQTNRMINEQQVICIYSFIAQQAKHEQKIGDIENDVIITNQLANNEDIEGHLEPGDDNKNDVDIAVENIKHQHGSWCRWSGQLKFLSAHLNKCVYATKPCSFSCIGCFETDIAKHKLLQHQSESHIFHTELLLKELISEKKQKEVLTLQLNESQQKINKLQQNNIISQNKINALCAYLGVMFDENNNVTEIPVENVQNDEELKNEEDEKQIIEDKYPNCSKTVYVIGYNKDYCQFGIHSNNNLEILTLLEWIKIKIGHKIIDIHCGQGNMGFITSTGSLWVCGKNSRGELGMGIDSKSIIKPIEHPFFQQLNIPIKTMGNGCFTSDHSIVILTNGDVYACGENKNGQLGIGDNNNLQLNDDNIEMQMSNSIQSMTSEQSDSMNKDYESKPIVTPGMDSVSMTQTSTIEQQEFVSEFKQINVKFYQDEKDEIIDVSYGLAHTIFLTKNGRVYGCGCNDHGALGISNNNHCTDINVPTIIDYFVENDIIISTISCGRLHSIFVDTNGNVYSCGRAQYGQLGIARNNNYDKYKPQRINWFNQNNIKIVKVKCGAWHCIAMDQNAQIYTWGHGMNGALGIGQTNENQAVPAAVSHYNEEFKEIKCNDIAAGYYHSIALTDDNKLYTFGYNGTYNSCVANVNDYNNENENENVINRAPKKFFKPHFVDLKKYFNNNDYLKQQYGKDLEDKPPVVLRIFGGFYSSILMLKD
eukprot:195286_1